MNPAVTVAIPTYNGSDFLQQTLESLFAQTFRDFEVLLVDDSSSDGSFDIASALARSEPRLRVFRTPSNLGAAPRALNFVLPHARGRYFAYASQDDLFSPDWLEKSVRRAESTGADAVLPDVVFMTGGANPTRLAGLEGNREIVITGRMAVQLSMDWTIHGFALWNCDLIRSIRFETFAMNSDEFSTRVFFLNCRRVAFSDGTFFYRQNNPNAITKRLSTGLFDVPETHRRLALFLREHGFPAPLVDAELMRAISSLLWMKQRLELSGTQLRPEQRTEAANRLREVFLRLQSEVAGISRRGGFSDRIKLGVLASPLAVFEFATKAAARLKARTRTPR